MKPVTKYCVKCGRQLIAKQIKTKPYYNENGNIEHWIYSFGVFPLREHLIFTNRPSKILICPNIWCKLKPASYRKDYYRYFIIDNALEGRYLDEQWGM